MAKSKSGGTRSYIRGRVGADVYSIGRDAKGAKQQVVRSLAETVANPQTVAQMRGRMIMSTVMQAVSGLRPIIDHSFDNVPTGQPSISEFISRNYALIKADVAANPASGNDFPLNAYQEKGVKGGAYVISDGEIVPSQYYDLNDSGDMEVSLPADSTLATLKQRLGLTADDYVTLVWLCPEAGAVFCRFRVDPSLSDDTVISNSNVNSVFLKEGNVSAACNYADGKVGFTLQPSTSETAIAMGFILSVKEQSGFKHSACTLENAADGVYNTAAADTVLPTYPVGTAMFLNGGDL